MKVVRILRTCAALAIGAGVALATLPAAAQRPAQYAPYAQPAIAPGAGHLIQRFYLAQGYGGAQPGSELVFVLLGQPGGKAWVNMPGGQQMPLAEVQPGEYQGRYVVSWGENPQALAQVFGALQVASTTTTTQLENRNAAAAAAAPRGWAYRR